ncbi:MAG: AMP-binding protein [Ruminococcus sp.]|nr:AMP-binding protein [Ruminococcus sp.]
MEYEKLTDLLRARSNINAEEKFVSEISTGTELTYVVFFQLVQERTRFMKNCGLQAGDKVGLLCRNGIEFMVDFFAILENDAIVVPANPALKYRELIYIFQDANLKYMITESKDRRMSKLAQALCTYKINQETNFVEIDSHVSEDLRPDNLTEGTALILHTSGSTGEAKGVMLTHQNLLSEMKNIITAHELTARDKVLCVLPWFHINGLVITMLTPLLAGHEIVVAEKFSQKNFWKWVDDYQVTWFSGVPTIYVYLLADTNFSPHNSLRFARSASSSLPIKVLEEFEMRYQVPIIESYGMTEGGSQLTSNPVWPGVRKPGSVGVPYGLEMRIVNDEGNVCQIGEAGEVQFCGDSISEGYYKKAEETEQGFDGRWLKTGDIGYLDEDGYLFLNGRKKEIINRSGEKFSPREIDEVLYQYKKIKMAAAVGVPDSVHGEEVVAFCVPKEEETLCESEIIEFCRIYLADYKVPKEIIFVEELAIGGNGKIQRLKLKDEYQSRRNKSK